MIKKVLVTKPEWQHWRGGRCGSSWIRRRLEWHQHRRRSSYWRGRGKIESLKMPYIFQFRMISFYNRLFFTDCVVEGPHGNPDLSEKTLRFFVVVFSKNWRLRFLPKFESFFPLISFFGKFWLKWPEVRITFIRRRPLLRLTAAKMRVVSTLAGPAPALQLMSQRRLSKKMREHQLQGTYPCRNPDSTKETQAPRSQLHLQRPVGAEGFGHGTYRGWSWICWM